MGNDASFEGVDREAHARLRNYLLVHGLKASRQREIIADVFFASRGHLRVEELLERARAIDAKVSQATVYRTMKLLVACDLAAARHFFDGQTRYERTDAAGEHHDHLICTHCGTIVEFVDPRIERLQDKVAAANGFVVTDHKMELYGLCATCRSAYAVQTEVAAHPHAASPSIDGAAPLRRS